MCAYECMHVCKYAFRYICVHVYVYVFISMCVFMFVCIHVCSGILWRGKLIDRDFVTVSHNRQTSVFVSVSVSVSMSMPVSTYVFLSVSTSVSVSVSVSVSMFVYMSVSVSVSISVPESSSVFVSVQHQHCLLPLPSLHESGLTACKPYIHEAARNMNSWFISWPHWIRSSHMYGQNISFFINNYKQIYIHNVISPSRSGHILKNT